MEKKSSKEILPEKERKLSVADWSELNKVLPLTQKYEQALESAEAEIEELKAEHNRIIYNPGGMWIRNQILEKELDSLRKENDRKEELIRLAYFAGFLNSTFNTFKIDEGWEDFKKENNIE